MSRTSEALHGQWRMVRCFENLFILLWAGFRLGWDSDLTAPVTGGGVRQRALNSQDTVLILNPKPNSSQDNLQLI